MTRKYYAVEVVRQIEETVEIMVEAPDQTAAHDAALAHLKARGSEYQWLNSQMRSHRLARAPGRYAGDHRRVRIAGLAAGTSFPGPRCQVEFGGAGGMSQRGRPA
ncbi:hypothetical protein ACVWZL_003177 [Bradyrhizobium sp. GM2.4]